MVLVHLTDSFSNVLGLAANQAASAAPDRDHPYGHHKFEALGALGIAALLAVTCLEIVRNGIDRIVHVTKPVQMSESDSESVAQYFARI